MKQKQKKELIIASSLLALFIACTFAVKYVDVRQIGPQESFVGMAALNSLAQSVIGTNMNLYLITDWASIAAILVALGFAILGLCQLIKRKSLLRVDRSILVLGCFYILVCGSYLFFEYFIVNYRPVLIGETLEASYPSSTTMLVMCIMPTAMLQYYKRIKRALIRNAVIIICGVYTALMVVGRLISGVHWITDIIGGILLSTSLVLFYCAVEAIAESHNNAQN